MTRLRQVFQLELNAHELDLISNALSDYRDSHEEDVFAEQPWLEELLDAVQTKVNKLSFEH